MMRLFACTVSMVCFLSVSTAGIPKPDADAVGDPELVIPTLREAPVIDGYLSHQEWQYAAALTGLQRYVRLEARGLRLEQAVFYVARHRDDLCVAMDSRGSTHTEILAEETKPDGKVYEDDAFEWMVGPGSRAEVDTPSFPVYYLILNAIGTKYDVKLVPNRNENHVGWELPLEAKSGVDGQNWSLEMKVPLRAFSRTTPSDGARWRMNFVRTYPKHKWSAWRAEAGFNDAHNAGNVTFDSMAPAVRLRSVRRLLRGSFVLHFQVANGTGAGKSIRFGAKAFKRTAAGWALVAEDIRQVTVDPGYVRRAQLGSGERLEGENRVLVEAVEEGTGKRLFFADYPVRLPVEGFDVKPAPKKVRLYAFPRYLPTKKRLAVVVDCASCTERLGEAAPRVHISVRKGGRKGKPEIEGRFAEFRNGEGTWHCSTAELAEGTYDVEVRLLDGDGNEVTKATDWFEKRVYDWLTSPVGVGNEVPAPFTKLVARDRQIRCWGRTYTFDERGLPSGVTSQGRELLAGPTELKARARGLDLAWTVAEPLQITASAGHLVECRSAVQAAGLEVSLRTETEYDGFVKYFLTYGPIGDGARPTLDSLRLSIPLKWTHARFYSALSDSWGTNIVGDVFPDRQGILLDSVKDMRAVALPRNFASLVWVGDHEVSFCYVGDSDEGWRTDEKKPCVQVERRGDVLLLHLNFVSRPGPIRRERTLAFGLQAGPVKPLPKGWRGMYFCRRYDEPIGPACWTWSCGGGWNFAGGMQIIHPGYSKQDWQRSAESIRRKVKPGVAAVEYNWYWHVPKIPEVRVLRGELGIDLRKWEAGAERFFERSYDKRVCGPDQDRYTVLTCNPVPSYVDLLTYAFDLAVRTTRIEGFYDDQGYPVPVFDEELGLGYVREDGKKIPCAGILIYRERWKRAAYVLWKHGRRNFLASAQHIGHLTPVYGFCGVFAGCEFGLTNTVVSRDCFDVFGSMDRYAAYTAAKQIGMMPCFALTSPQKNQDDFRKDTRCMMMLTMLNDHDLGGWKQKNRNPEVIAQVRKAKNRFVPWEEDVEFLGYWTHPARASEAAILVSAYRASDRALFVVGNTSKQAVSATVRPDWSRLGLGPADLRLVDAETGHSRTLDRQRPDGGFGVTVAGHNLRLIMANVGSR